MRFRNTATRALWSRVLVGVALAGCVGCTSPPADYPASEAATLDPIIVSAMDLRPTISMDAEVVASPVFAVSAPSSGVVSGFAALDAKVKAGDTVAVIDGTPVLSPTAGVVIAVLSDPGQIVPANLPLVAVRYSGFALLGTPTQWAQSLLPHKGVTARGQVKDEQSPFTCDGFLPSVSGESVGASWLCLLPKDVTAAANQGGVVVATGEVASGVVAVPLGAVAGRVGSGQVTLIVNGESQVVDVKLGLTDGSNIEVTAGLSVGDHISPIAPNLAVKHGS